MPSPYIKQKTKIVFKSAAPVSLLLLGFQAVLGVKFACPCDVKWNKSIAVLIGIVPTLFSLVMMLLFFRFLEQKASEGSEGQNSREKSWPERILHWIIRFIPPVVWICVFFIDGDYFACGETDWNGTYTCDTRIHPNCVSWCKPEPKNGTNETELYNNTKEKIILSKKIGYVQALISCGIVLLIILIIMCKDKGRRSGEQVVTYTRPETVQINQGS